MDRQANLKPHLMSEFIGMLHQEFIQLIGQHRSLRLRRMVNIIIHDMRRNTAIAYWRPMGCGLCVVLKQDNRILVIKSAVFLDQTLHHQTAHHVTFHIHHGADSIEQPVYRQ